MVQIKLFVRKTCRSSDVENLVNTYFFDDFFLRANELITYSPIVLNYYKINLLKNIHELLI